MAEIEQYTKDAVALVWRDLVEYLDEQALSQEYFVQLLAAYSQSHRHYHNCTHLAHVFGLLQSAGVRDHALYWAAFYHDYIYQPGNADNEQQSALVADKQLQALGIADEIRKRVTLLIIATRDHHIDTDDEAAALFLDADMAILGAEPATYKTYTDNLRKEFSAIPGLLFTHGRKKFLQGLLARERIFTSDWFYSRYEQQARENIHTELGS